MTDFRHNLTPVEIKLFLKTLGALTDDLLIRFCYKIPGPCPRCGHPQICRSGAISMYSSSFDKLTHEITVCLHCLHKQVAALLTCERM
jgi:hypothetical protein